MRHPKIIIAGIALTALAAGGGITEAAASGSPAASATAAPATVRTAPAAVAGKTETILINGRGLPLYYYQPDTAPTSLGTRGHATTDGTPRYPAAATHTAGRTGGAPQAFCGPPPAPPPHPGPPAEQPPAAPSGSGFGY